MSETHRVIIRGTNKETTITDLEPLASAVLFKQLTDELWRKKPRKNKTAAFSIQAGMRPLEARDEMNEVLGSINDRMILSGANKKLFLRDSTTHHGRRVAFAPAVLAEPVTAHIGIYNWDSRAIDRQMEIDGEREVVEFTDGHTDYHREIYVGFGFPVGKNEQLDLEYRIQRYQPHQDKPTALDLTAHYSKFRDQGYESNNLSHTNLYPEQELSVLRTFQRIGNIILPTI